MDNEDRTILSGDCNCECHDVELISEREPIVLLFDEYAETYQEDIVDTKKLAQGLSDEVLGDGDEVPSLRQFIGDSKEELADLIEEKSIDPDIVAKEETSQQILTEATAAKNAAQAAKDAAQAITGYAKEAAATANKQEVIGAVNAAKAAIQGNDTTATNTAILQAIQQGGGGGDAKESTSQAILSSLPKFSVENDDTLVIYSEDDEHEKRVSVWSTGVYRMKWSEDLAEALDLEGAISTLIANFIDDNFAEMLVSASLDTHPISVQAMKVGEDTELFFIPLDGAGETYTLQELTDIVNDLWDGETYLYLQFRFNNFPFTESAGITFEELVEGYYWKLSYPLYVDSENEILSYPAIQDIIPIENSDESN